jgi:hypothetical protein
MPQPVGGADIVFRALERAGHDTIFMLSGNHIMSLFDAAISTSRQRQSVREPQAADPHQGDRRGAQGVRPARRLSARNHRKWRLIMRQFLAGLKVGSHLRRRCLAPHLDGGQPTAYLCWRNVCGLKLTTGQSRLSSTGAA